MRRVSGTPPVADHLQSSIANLLAEEARLREELRQLQAAVEIYNEILATLALRTGRAS